jgi:hypothetical protein
MARDRTRIVSREDRCGVRNPAASMGRECVLIGKDHKMHRDLNGDRWPAVTGEPEGCR